MKSDTEYAQEQHEAEFQKLGKHVGHHIVCVSYAGENHAVECNTCNEVIYSVNKEMEK